MSVGALGKATNEPRESVAVQSRSEREAMFGEMPGKVVAFDSAKQTITVQPMYRPTHNGTPVDMPELLEVPVRFPRMGGFVVTTPVKSGDMVTLRPQMRSSEEFHTGGAYETPGDTRSMSLSDMEAFLDGGESLANPIENFNSDNLEIRSADGRFKIEMSEDGRFKIDGAQGNVFELLGDLLDALATDNLTINYGSSAGSGHQLQNRNIYESIRDKFRAMQL